MSQCWAHHPDGHRCTREPHTDDQHSHTIVWDESEAVGPPTVVVPAPQPGFIPPPALVPDLPASPGDQRVDRAIPVLPNIAHSIDPATGAVTPFEIPDGICVVCKAEPQQVGQQMCAKCLGEAQLAARALPVPTKACVTCNHVHSGPCSRSNCECLNAIVG